MQKTTTFQDLPIGARFYLNAGEDDMPPVHLIKTSDEGYEDAANRRIHGDCDLDYPVIEVK